MHKETKLVLCLIRYRIECIKFTLQVASSQHQIKWQWTGGFSYWPASFLIDRKHPANNQICFFWKGSREKKEHETETQIKVGRRRFCPNKVI